MQLLLTLCAPCALATISEFLKFNIPLYCFYVLVLITEFSLCPVFFIFLHFLHLYLFQLLQLSMRWRVMVWVWDAQLCFGARLPPYRLHHSSGTKGRKGELSLVICSPLWQNRITSPPSRRLMKVSFQTYSFIPAWCLTVMFYRWRVSFLNITAVQIMKVFFTNIVLFLQ